VVVARNQRLDDAIRQRGWSVAAFAEAIEVDPKTALRWVSTGRVPHPRQRQRAAAILGVSAAVLWPDAAAPAAGVAELAGLYETRTGLSTAAVRTLLVGATQAVDVLVYSGLWLWDGVTHFAETLAEKAASGVAVRLCLGDPDSQAVLDRGAEEGIGANLAARCRLALTYAAPLVEAFPEAVRISDATLYASILRFDDDMFANVHLWGNPAAESPVLHLRRSGEAGVAENVLRSFGRVWDRAQPVVG
jgi:lambda repressor-like predicted transcriptional regulator